jgi:DNA-directed RNA polymerase specialized sigma24 family protein
MPAVERVNIDSQLVARAQGGDQDAFAELFRRHSDRVFRLALSILGQGFAAEAEDVAQEVFLKVYHALASFRGDAEFGSWIYRITFNQAVNVKSRARYRSPHLEDTVLSDVATAEPGPHSLLETGTPQSISFGMHPHATRGLPVRSTSLLLAGGKCG